MGEVERGEFITQSQEARNVGVLRAWYPRWIWNHASNFAPIRKEFLVDKKRSYSLASHQNQHKGPAVIIGAGPSLNETGPLLKDWKGPIFVPESMAETCRYYGHSPEYILLYDGHPNNYRTFLSGMDWKGSTLVTHPGATEQIQEWPYEKIYYTMYHDPRTDYSRFHPNMQLDEMIDEVIEQKFGKEFFDVIIPILFPYIAAAVKNAGCVANNAIQIANFMGYDPIFLVGVDLGYPNEMDRANGFKWNPKTEEWETRESQPVNKVGRPLHTAENGVTTTEEQIEYKIAMMAVMKIDKPHLIDCSDGIITELPKANFAEVVQNNGKGYGKRDHQVIERIADDFHARQQELLAERNDDRESEEVRVASGAEV